MTEKKPAVEFIGTLGDLKPRLDSPDLLCSGASSGCDPCSSAGLD